MKTLEQKTAEVFGTNMEDGLLAKGVQDFFINGENFTLASVFVGYNDATTGRRWMKTDYLHWGSEDDGTDIEKPYRMVETDCGLKKAFWDDHFEAWMPKW